MVHINTDIKTYKPPFQVVVLDMMDAYYYADVVEHMETFDTVPSLVLAKNLADALFVVKNYKWESLAAMNHVDGGYDVRVYDADFSCIYAAHTRYKGKWLSQE